MRNLYAYRVMPEEMAGLILHIRLIGREFVEVIRMKNDPDVVPATVLSKKGALCMAAVITACTAFSSLSKAESRGVGVGDRSSGRMAPSR